MVPFPRLPVPCTCFAKKFTYEHGNASIPSLEFRKVGQTIAWKGRPNARYNDGHNQSRCRGAITRAVDSPPANRMSAAH